MCRDQLLAAIFQGHCKALKDKPKIYLKQLKFIDGNRVKEALNEERK
jgi:hypothetical protein